MKSRRTREKNPVKTMFIIVDIVLVLVVLCYGGYVFYNRYCDAVRSRIIKEVTIETGDTIELGDFFTDDEIEHSFLTDVSKIDTSYPGTYILRVKAGHLTEEVRLNVTDTTPPEAVAIPQTIYTGRIPDARQCVQILSNDPDAEIAYLEDDIELNYGGDYLIPVTVTDVYGNEMAIHVPFTVIDDHNAPLIYGPHDLEYFIGDNIVYREGITVTDDYDPNPSLEIDTSAVIPDQEGTYPVRYIATDEYGNQRITEIQLSLREMPEGYVEPEEVYALAQQVLDEITEPGLTDTEIAFRIFRWARNYIHYVGTSIKTDWTAGAYEGFTTLRGDCYTYYACCKALLDVAGIPNEMVIRNPAYTSMHFWNLVYLEGGWYHCDSCPSTSHEGFWFMRTDSELDYSHRFDTEDPELPARAEESVQNRLDFYNLTIREEG